MVMTLERLEKFGALTGELRYFQFVLRQGCSSSSMKFLHTSDWHLGRQLHHQSLLDDQRHVLQQIIQIAAQQQVDAVVVAGDIYDRSVPPANAVALLDEVLHQLVIELNIPVILIAGNHDGHERLGFACRHLAASGLHIIGPLPQSISPIQIQGKNGSAWFYPLPYAEPATVRHLLDLEVNTHQQAMEALLQQVHQHDAKGLAKVVIGHCFLAGGDESESERPLSLGGADQISPQLFESFHYAALGHLHGPQFRGANHVRYSGSPLKYSFSEQHQKKSVTLVELNGEGKAQVELFPLRPLRDVRIIEGYLDELLEQGKTDHHCDDYLMIRLMDKSAILDAMGKLRAVYPNVLHLERTGLLASQDRLELARDQLKKSEHAMFADFFEQVSGEVLSDEQSALINKSLERIHHGKDEGEKA